ncbi:MAG: FadR/GntR family transcriptional regulator [Chloroflexota bacterium]
MVKTNINPFRHIDSKERLVDRVVDELERLIVEGELEPETRLPPERELAEQLGVSRTVIREASRILVTKGLLETRHGVGTMVRQITSEHVVEPLNRLLRTHSSAADSFKHLYQVRLILEVEIAGLAAQQATEDEIIQLKQILLSMEAARHTPDILAAKDAEFHRALAQMTHNPLLAVLLNSIRDLLQEYIMEVTPYLDPRQDVLPPHYEILNCVEAKDEEGARQAMRAHLVQMRKNHEKYAKISGQKE